MYKHLKLVSTILKFYLLIALALRQILEHKLNL